MLVKGDTVCKYINPYAFNLADQSYVFTVSLLHQDSRIVGSAYESEVTPALRHWSYNYFTQPSDTENRRYIGMTSETHLDARTCSVGSLQSISGVVDFQINTIRRKKKKFYNHGAWNTKVEGHSVTGYTIILVKSLQLVQLKIKLNRSNLET